MLGVRLGVKHNRMLEVRVKHNRMLEVRVKHNRMLKVSLIKHLGNGRRIRHYKSKVSPRLAS
jgi:hypothetical protein